MLKKDIPSNHNRKPNTLYVNPKEASMKDKLSNLVTVKDTKIKTARYKPKLIPQKDHSLIQMFDKSILIIYPYTHQEILLNLHMMILLFIIRLKQRKRTARLMTH